MKSRNQIYRGEGERLLKLITTYHALQYEQVLQFFIRNRDSMKSLITSLIKQGRIYYDQDVVFQIKRAANLQIILAPYKIDVVLQPHYPETLLHITRTKILPCKLIAQEYSVSSYENGSSSSSIWQA